MNYLKMILIGLVLQLLIGFAIGELFYAKGFEAAKDSCQKGEIAALNAVIDKTELLTRDANAASLALNKSISDQKRADQKSTEVFAHALASTANARVNCVFDRNIMQQLDEAADRADNAAASGINRAVSAGSSTAK